MITARDVCRNRLQKKVTQVALVVAAIVAALVLPKSTWAAAGNNQICTTGTTCTVGEFLYDDSYNPLNTASCQITSRYPNGSLYLNATVMTVASENDGWYSYSFTAPATTGIYRTEVRCTTTDVQVLAIDKSFEVAAAPSTLSADDVATATWGYSGRTLSSFGSLVSGIWENGTRTLTGAGLSSGSIATKADVDSVSSQTASVNKKVDDATATVNTVKKHTSSIVNTLEKFINVPIIQNLIEDDGLVTYSINTKIDKTRSVAGALAANAQYLKSKAGIIDARWNDLKIERMVASFKSMQVLLGEDRDSISKNSIFGNVNWMTKKWGWKEADSIAIQTKSIKLKLSSLSKNLIYNGKSKEVRYDLKSLSLDANKLYSLIGNSSLLSKQNNLYSKVNDTYRFSVALDLKYSDVATLLNTWDVNNKNLNAEVKSLTEDVIKINRLPKIDLAFIPVKKESPDRTLRNKALSLLGIINANRKLLSQSSNSAFSSTWLELGSIVFKSIITNPSSTISQTVPFRYDLPKEVKKEDVLEIDTGLTLGYDSEKNNYYISGTFDLSPNESKTVSARVDDKTFEISDKLIASLRKQAEALSIPLKNTSFFAQGVTLKSDIDVSLDKALSLKSEASTPDAKIRSYRDAKIELDAARVKIEKLKEIVATAGSVGTFFGFVGGTQTLAVWGMIIIMIAGFVFLTLYMRTMRLQDVAGRSQVAVMSVSEVATKGKKGKGKANLESSVLPIDSGKPKIRFNKTIIVGLLILGVFGASGFVMSGLPGLRQSSEKKQIIPTKTEKKIAGKEKKVLGKVASSNSLASSSAQITILVPPGGVVSIYKEPSLVSEELVVLEKSQRGDMLSEKDGWVKVSTKKGKETVVGWVDGDFTEELKVSVKTYGVKKAASTVTVEEDLTGFLRVRESAPDGEIVQKISAGEKFVFVSEEDGWTQIELENGKTGWVSSEFVKIIPDEN